MDERRYARELPVDEQGIDALKEGIELRLMNLAELLGPEDTLAYVISIGERMERELEE